MKTDDLIKALAADTATRTPPVGATLARTLSVGLMLSVIVFALVMRVRPDIASALQTWRFDLKLLLAAGLAAAAGWLVLCLSRPGADATRPKLAVMVVPVLLAASVAIELVSLPPDLWMRRAVGSNALWCLASVPVLALAPLAAVLVALRNGAPQSPALAGAAAGLLAGALGAGIYGTHCWDDSPLFVVIWYPLAIAAVAVLGALTGSRMLRW